MDLHDDKSVSIEIKRMRIALIPTVVFLSFLWLFLFLDITLDLQLYKLGVYPLKTEGLPGILFSPLIHSSVKHLFSNTIPLFVLMWCLFYFYSEIAYKTFLLLWLLSGLFTWIIGRESWHIGASGIVYSLSFFLFFSGLFRKHIPLIAISLVVAFLYGSNVWNMLPWSMYLDATVSWEGHLSGGISGLIIAIIYRNHGPQKPVKEWIDEDEEEEDFFNVDDEFYDDFLEIQ
ncbi:MAG TPA: rhomboid family intramembrane serine protease [Dysgonamonadaceae bacterium]|jgi:membrane associated rhomboid family serine protease|nr:rhomboid family intramembrane serine protease [Dysgonamonadaceae bacterium]